MQDYTAILEKALARAKKLHPDGSPYHWAAFANAVAYLLTGQAGGYGGPSVREHACARLTRTDDFNLACSEAEPIVFGPLTDLHREMWADEHCFDDDPADVAELSK